MTEKRIYIDIFPNEREAIFMAQEHARNLPEDELGKNPTRLTSETTVTYYISVHRAAEFVRGMRIEDYHIRQNVQWNRDLIELKEILESRKIG